MKRSGFKRRKPTKAPKRVKSTAKGYSCPRWFKDIKPGSHGSTPAQKRLWRIISEHVRQRDFDAYGGKCVSCPTRLSDWRDGHAGHWLPYSICNAWMKWDISNIHLSCPSCNYGLTRSGAHIGHAMAEEMKRRMGDDVIDKILARNNSLRGTKVEEWEMVELVAALRPDLVEFSTA